jgi:hypothetical protein
MLSKASSLYRLNVSISTVNYEVTVSDFTAFANVFNVTDRSVSALERTGCFINNYNGGPDYSSKAMQSSYQIYLAFGLIVLGNFPSSLVAMLVMKTIQLLKFDFVKTLYNMSNLRANFNLSNYHIWNFLFCAFISDHYIFYNQVFNSTTGTCLGVTYSYYFGSTHTYYQDPSMVHSLSHSSWSSSDSPSLDTSSSSSSCW